jgi:antitoxin ParD1/3/4
MTFSLPPELEEFINQKVASGLYQTANEVIRDALGLLRKRDDQRQDLLKNLAVGIEQANQGKGIPFDEETVERIKERGRESRRSNGTQPK